MSDNQQVKLTMLMLLALLLMSHGVGNIRCSTLPENSTDMLVLLDFRALITDARGALTSWWNTSIPYCKWRGITCNPKNHGRVTAINLASQGLSGPIAASFRNLTLLHTLDLSDNQFSGQIPDLNNLQRMQVLKLNQNSLNGTIPDTLTNCSNLKELHLYTNFLEGAIPREIGFLKNLVFLGLAYNNLIGTIPPTVGNITHLEKLYLGYNQLEGRIPDELGQLSNISIMDLPQNKLSGSIPESLFNLSSLKTLGLNINQLSKSLPNDVGDRLSSLQQLFLGYNMLEGHIPDSLGNASMLRQVSLESNNLTGQIPSSLGRLSRLFFLNLQKNMLEAKDSESWEFLQALGNCSALQKLQLAGNQLQGLIPISVGNLPASLEHLILGGNNLSGVVPPSIGNLSALIELSLDQGSLTGNIGHWIANLNRLQGLYLSNNSFSGPIPASIGTLTNLSELFLGNNDFDSPIPQSLWDLRALQKLSVSYNNLQGNISPEIGNLKQLRNLDLSSNKLSGEIPDTLGQCTDLTDVQMNQNLLAGSIPASFGKLESLSLLNLSHNTLSGTIPTSLGDLLQLRELDLSYNHLQGQIPINGIFKNATAVSLEKNWGLCGEVGDLGVPSCPSISRKISRQYYLVRILIPIFGFMSLLLLIYFLILEKKMPRRKNLELASFGEYFLKVSYNDLAQATKNFAESNLIGRGSCGSVYKGTIKESKIEVAVKVFNLEMRGAERSFMAECEALRSIQHRNLLPIITACSTVDSTGNVFKALVYEFMPNGSLDSWLHHHKGDGNATKRLGLTKTISIAANIADALDYLHHDCGRPTVHCDVKPSNILLDEEMDALLGDFGIARFYADSRLTSPGSISSIGVKGTIGYIAPEYAQGGHVSTSADAYSFGIVLLEMMTGKRPTDPMFVDGFNLVNFVESNFPHQIHHIIDAHLKEECNNEFAQANMVPENVTHQCLASLLQVALSCAHPLPSERANMKEAASKIHAIKTTHLGWKSKK